MNIRKFILFLSISWALVSVLQAQSSALLFLTIDPGGRPTGMGGAYIAEANDASATYYNPAGLAFIDTTRRQLFFSFSNSCNCCFCVCTHSCISHNNKHLLWCVYHFQLIWASRQVLLKVYETSKSRCSIIYPTWISMITFLTFISYLVYFFI